MFIKQFMTSRVITVPPTESISSAMNIMKSRRINRLPVLSGGKLVGLVTDGDLRGAMPSPATTLSKFEMNELLSKMTIKDVAVKKVITCTPETQLEEAALLMRENKIGGLPVMDGDQLVGIVTQNNILDAFLDVMGARSPGKRIVIAVKDEIGILSQIALMAKEFHVDIASLAVYHFPEKKAQILVRFDGENVEQVINTLREKGFDIME